MTATAATSQRHLLAVHVDLVLRGQQVHLGLFGFIAALAIFAHTLKSSLAESAERLSAAERTALAHSIYAQARDMSEQVAKVLQMTRLETG